MSHGHLVFHIDVTNGATVLVSVGSSLEVADLELEELHQAAKIRQHTPDVQRLFDQHGFSLNSLGRELKNALERAAPQGSEAFEKLRRLWRKTKKKLAILEASTPTRAGPRAFVDQVGSNAALVSWEVLEHLTEGFFEVVLLGYQERTERTSVTRSVPRTSSPRVAKLGMFRVEGGHTARSYRLGKLQALRWYRVRVRSVGPRKGWISEWSNEVAFRTMSLSAARDSGLLVNSSNFLVKSERLLRHCVDDSTILEATAEERNKIQVVRDILGASGAQTSASATSNLLGARYGQKGWPDFVKNGSRFSRPANQREQRMRRVRLAVAAIELYGPNYPLQNEQHLPASYLARLERHLEMLGLAKSHFACRNLHPHEEENFSADIRAICFDRNGVAPKSMIEKVSDVHRGCPTRQSPEGLIDRRDQSTRDPMPAMRIQVMKLSKAQEVFQNAGVDSFLDSVLEGYHATVFAYGQTGSGKTHTMEGFVYQAGTQSKAPQVKPALTAPEKLGIVPRCIEGLFQRMEQQSLAGDCSFTFRLSFLQIYNERIFDLLNPVHLTNHSLGGLRLHWNPRESSVSVENLFVFECRTPGEALNYYKAGVKNRTVASHQMNQASSRSHSVLTLTIERRSDHSVDRVSKLTLVDLAGSERQAITGASGRTLQESVGINQSLFVLRKVIMCLAKRKGNKLLVPYRESKLTILLRDAIGGSGYTLMLACLSILDSNFEENVSTLQYACTAGSIRNRPVVNLDPTTLLIRQLRREVQFLKGQLSLAENYVLRVTGKPIPREVLQGDLTHVPEFVFDVGESSQRVQHQQNRTPRRANDDVKVTPSKMPPAASPPPDRRIDKERSETPSTPPDASTAPASASGAAEPRPWGGPSGEIWAERLSEAVAALQVATSDNMALRRRWEAAMEERDALQIQVNNMEKEMMLAGESQVVPNVLGFAGAMSGSELAALTTMRASTFYDVLLLREDSGTAGHIHVRECVFCRNTIDRQELHYSCPEKCRFDVCQYCYKSQIAKAKVNAAGRSRSPASSSVKSTPDFPTGGSAASRNGAHPDFGGRLALPGEPGASAPRGPPPLHTEEQQQRKTPSQFKHHFRAASQQFLESSWQRSVEVVFWIVIVLAGDFIGASYIEKLTTAEVLAFPYPFLTAFVSNLVAGVLAILILMMLDRFDSRGSLGELAAVGGEMDLKMQIILGILITCEIGAAVKVLSNVHHTMAAWFYMLTPVATILVASSNYFRMEVLQKELLTAAGVASFGGMLAVKGPWPSLEGLTALQWAFVAVVITVARCLLTQRINVTRPRREAGGAPRGQGSPFGRLHGRCRTVAGLRVERLLVTSLAVEGFSLPNALHHRLLPGAERHWLHSLDPDHLSDLRCSPGALPHGDHSAH
ncbi:Chromosome-associated kinesin KIF4B (Chromokinesin-B) [Durusdinium trenchii]|uniref:Chromosome-associated kinesin KIF4B (Chromokinesin-B) n=1 Tax=Durusdinium trenchii TaxID=1381693 RepID=A0ABP0JNL1_9DINO